MEVFDSRYYKYNKLFLKTIGCWAYDRGLKKRFFQALATFSIMLSLVPQISYIYINRSDMNKVLQCGPPVLIIVIPMCQLFIYIFSEKKLYEMLETIKNDWEIRKERLGGGVLKKFAETGRFYTWVYVANVGTASVTVIMMSMTNPVLDWLIPLNETRLRQGVFDAALPFDQTEHFHYVLLCGTLTGMYNLSVVSSCESFFSAAIFHACGLFNIVSTRCKIITEMLNNGKVNMNPPLTDPIFKELSCLIEDHTHALDFADDLNSMFSPFLFITVVFNVGLLSTSGLRMLTALDEPDTFIKYIAYTFGVFLHFYCVALPAQKLLDHSGDVSLDAYDICWYNIPSKSKRTILLLIQRSQEPCKLTAGKFYNMDMETFSALVQASVSFFSVLFSMR